MILTGVCKTDFLKHFKKHTKSKLDTLDKAEVMFNVQDELFQHALIIDFFDSKGIHLYAEPYLSFFNKELLFKGYILGYRNINEQNSYTDRASAIRSIIRIANEYYNT